MSEPTLYLENLETGDILLDGFEETRDRYLSALRGWGVLVPVERCKEHRRIDEHVYYDKRTGDAVLCPGAGIGVDDEVDYETHTLMQGGIGDTHE